MLSQKARLAGRTAVFASLTALALGALAPTQADARPLHRHYGGGAAAAAAIGAIGAIGTGLAIAASRDAYAYDYGGPVYYDEGPVYSAPSYYYGAGYRSGHYPYQVYGGQSPYDYCGQATTWNCR